jgi:hypothetical protein
MRTRENTDGNDKKAFSQKMTIVEKTNTLLLGKCIQQIDDERER